MMIPQFLVLIFVCLFSTWAVPLSAQEKLTRAGLSAEQLIDCYGKNWDLSEAQFSMMLVNDENSPKYRVFLFDPFDLEVDKAAFPKCSFIRFFCTSDIVHGVFLFAGVKRNTKLTYVMTDKQAEDFLQESDTVIETVDALKGFMTAFTKLRSYDILMKKPKLITEWKSPLIYDRNYPDSEWGISCDHAGGTLKGYVTVVVDLYSSILRRYDFELTDRKKVKISSQKDLFVGCYVR